MPCHVYMYVCMYVCMYVFMYVCMHACMHGWMHTYKYGALLSSGNPLAICALTCVPAHPLICTGTTLMLVSTARPYTRPYMCRNDVIRVLICAGMTLMLVNTARPCTCPYMCRNDADAGQHCSGIVHLARQFLPGRPSQYGCVLGLGSGVRV